MNVLTFYEENQAKSVLNTPDEGSNNIVWNPERGEAQHWDSDGAYQCAIWPPSVRQGILTSTAIRLSSCSAICALFLPLDESCLPFPLLLLLSDLICVATMLVQFLPCSLLLHLINIF